MHPPGNMAVQSPAYGIGRMRFQASDGTKTSLFTSSSQQMEIIRQLKRLEPNCTRALNLNSG